MQYCYLHNHSLPSQDQTPSPFDRLCLAEPLQGRFLPALSWSLLQWLQWRLISWCTGILQYIVDLFFYSYISQWNNLLHTCTLSMVRLLSHRLPACLLGYPRGGYRICERGGTNVTVQWHVAGGSAQRRVVLISPCEARKKFSQIRLHFSVFRMGSRGTFVLALQVPDVRRLQVQGPPCASSLLK